MIQRKRITDSRPREIDPGMILAGLIVVVIGVAICAGLLVWAVANGGSGL